MEILVALFVGAVMVITYYVTKMVLVAKEHKKFVSQHFSFVTYKQRLKLVKKNLGKVYKTQFYECFVMLLYLYELEERFYGDCDAIKTISNAERFLITEPNNLWMTERDAHNIVMLNGELRQQIKNTHRDLLELLKRDSGMAEICPQIQGKINNIPITNTSIFDLARKERYTEYLNLFKAHSTPLKPFWR